MAGRLGAIDQVQNKMEREYNSMMNELKDSDTIDMTSMLRYQQLADDLDTATDATSKLTETFEKVGDSVIGNLN